MMAYCIAHTLVIRNAAITPVQIRDQCKRLRKQRLAEQDQQQTARYPQ